MAVILSVDMANPSHPLQRERELKLYSSAREAGREQIGDRESMLATEHPLENVEDFVKIIYIRLYGQRKTCKSID